jgi:hypothetical protein
MSGGFFFPLSLVLWVVHYRLELWSSLTRWLACEQYLAPSVHKAGCNWDLSWLTTSFCKVVLSVVFARQQLCSPASATLFGYLLPPARWGNLVLSTAISSMGLDQQPYMPPFWEVGFFAQPYSESLFLSLLSFAKSSAPCPTPVLWGCFSVPTFLHCWC